MKNRMMIKDFRQVLKDFEPMVKNPAFLRNGRDMPNFSLRPREAWGNWLLCAVLRHCHDDRITFSDDDQGDGYLIDKSTGGVIPTEHISVLEIPSKKPLPKGEKRIIEAIRKKIDRGADYAAGKFLVVFFEEVGEFVLKKVREAVRDDHNFREIYVIGLLSQDDEGYHYSVSEMRYNESMIYIVTVSTDFENWHVEALNPEHIRKYQKSRLWYHKQAK